MKFPITQSINEREFKILEPDWTDNKSLDGKEIIFEVQYGEKLKKIIVQVSRTALQTENLELTDEKIKTIGVGYIKNYLDKNEFDESTSIFKLSSITDVNQFNRDGSDFLKSLSLNT